MIAEKKEMFRNRLRKVYRHLQRVARTQGVSCYRVYDRDLPEFPLIIEKYEEQIYVAEYRSKHGLSEEDYQQWWAVCGEVVQEVFNVDAQSIFFKQRQRKAGRQGQYQRLGNADAFTVVKENGLQFQVNLSDYIDTGLFLDHRLTRAMVRDLSAGKRVLNLFCYTGSFSVYAAAGGARSVESVDLSNTYLSWAKRNFLLNGYSPAEPYTFVKADVLTYLKQLPAASYDLLVVDPPTFSNSKMMQGIWDIQQDHPFLLRECLRVMPKGGLLFFSTNYRRFQLDPSSLEGHAVADITRATTPFDFEGKLQRCCFRIQK